MAAAPALSPAADSDIAEIVAGEHARLAAMCAGDAATLAELWAEDFTYTHSNGSIDGKHGMIARLGGPARYSDGEILEARVRLLGDTAIVNGRFRLTVSVPGAETRLHGQVLAVWGRRQGRWQQLATASTPILASARQQLEEAAK